MQPAIGQSSQASSRASLTVTAKPLRYLAAPSIPTSAGSGMTIIATATKWASPAPVKRSYQWLLSGRPISGKTTTSLKLATSYLGKRINLRETATFKNRTTSVATSNGLIVGQIKVMGSPSIEFVGDSGTVMQINLPTPSPAGAKAIIAWQRGLDDVAGATKNTFTATEDDYGITFTGSVRYSLKGYQTTEALYSQQLFVADPNSGGPGIKTLVWQQDFNESAGTRADSSIWTPDIGDGTSVGNVGWGNAERQYYTADSVATDGSGSLVLSASRDASQYNCYYGTCEWKSGKITTKGKLGFKYGRIESRIKNATGKGTWPAFWMLGANYREAPGQSADWPYCGEIDIMETTGDNPLTNFGTPHSPDFHTGGQYQFTEPSANEYHDYAIEWTRNHIAWFVDDVKYYEVSAAMYGNNYYPFNNEFYLLLDLAMGGAWPGNVASNVQSAKLSVDWIRFYTIDGVGQVITH